MLFELLKSENVGSGSQAQISLIAIGHNVVPKLIPALENSGGSDLVYFSNLLHITTSLGKDAKPLEPVLSKLIDKEQDSIKQSLLRNALNKIKQTNTLPAKGAQ